MLPPWSGDRLVNDSDLLKGYVISWGHMLIPGNSIQAHLQTACCSYVFDHIFFTRLFCCKYFFIFLLLYFHIIYKLQTNLGTVCAARFIGERSLWWHLWRLPRRLCGARWCGSRCSITVLRHLTTLKGNTSLVSNMNFIFHLYMGGHPSHWRTPSFFRGVGIPPTR